MSHPLSSEDVARWCAWAGISFVGALHRRVLDEVYWADDDGLVALEEVILSGLELMAGGCSGPLADECGRAPAGGDNDFDGDVPEVAWRDGPGWGYRWRGRVYWFSSVGRADERRRVWGEPSPALLRFYWPRDCDGNGADDIPRDCLEAM